MCVRRPMTKAFADLEPSDLPLADWQAYLEHVLSTVAISSMVLPGTHGSCAYMLSPDIQIATSRGSESAVQLLPKFMPCLVSAWTCCQPPATTIYEQLMLGIRFLDFRVSLTAQLGGQQAASIFCGSHTFPCAAMMDLTAQIVRFLESHAGEVVVLRITPDWEHRHHFTATEGNQLLQLLQEVAGPHIFNRGGWVQQQQQLPTLGEVLAAGTRLLVLAEFPFDDGAAASGSCASHVWPPGSSTVLWANKPSPQDTLDGLLKLIEQHAAQPGTGMTCVSFAVTPDWPVILSGTLAGALQHTEYGLQPMAQQTRQLLPSLLEADLRAARVMAVLMDGPWPEDVRAIIYCNLCPTGFIQALDLM